MSGHWEHFHHVADVGVRGIGSTPAEAFEQAALAMTAVIVDPAAIEPRVAVDIRCRAPDVELLLVDWLNALLLEMATSRMLFVRFYVGIDNHCLQARAWGEPVDVDRHRPVVEVKGATYTELHVDRRQDGSWRAQCVVDV